MNGRNPPTTHAAPAARILPPLVFLSFLLAAGCETRPTTRPARKPNSAATAQQDHLELALESLKQFHESEPTELRRQVLYHLNRWIDGQGADEAWRPDPQIDRLPRRFRELPDLAKLDSPVFLPDDVRYLTEAYLLHSIGKWVAEDASRRWLDAKQEAAGADAVVLDAALETHEFRLEVAKALFDWTVRHVQLDELPPYPQSSSSVGPGAAGAESVSPPAQGIPGPGYRYYPQQTLLFGNGDAWQRARVFLLLARQQGIPAVMLAANDRGPDSRANLWLPAVLIDSKLYLFDTSLGLPIPGPEPGSVATLSDVLADPDMLRRLDVDDDGQTLRYPVSGDDLKRVAALVDADAPALSRRMQMLENRLTGKNLLALAVSPTAVAKQLRDSAELSGIAVRLWTLPFETQIYREALPRLARRDPRFNGG
jgi:hypothetical protein